MDAALHATLADVAEGRIPEDAVELDQLARDIVAAAGTSTQTLAVIVAVRREQMDTTPQWLRWAAEELGLSGSYLHHLRKVGDMLLHLATAGSVAAQHYRRVFPLAYNRLIVLARLRGDEIIEFLRANPNLEGRSREELRSLVDAWQGLAKEDRRSRQPSLPGLDLFLEFAERNEDKATEIFTAAAATPERAEMCVKTGFRLVAGALANYKAAPAAHLEKLAQIRADLVDELTELDAAIAAAHEQL